MVLLLVFVLASAAQGKETPYPRVNVIGVNDHEEVWLSVTLESYLMVPTCTLEGTVSLLRNDRPTVKLLPDHLAVACVGSNRLTAGVRDIVLNPYPSTLFIELTALKGGLEYRGEGGFVEEEQVACGNRAASPDHRKWEWGAEGGALQALEEPQEYVCRPGRGQVSSGLVESKAELSTIDSREPLRFRIEPPTS
ncbi:MAG: hypothetical protein ACLQBB_03045 [Solirubrobacteraceae bacterium]